MKHLRSLWHAAAMAGMLSSLAGPAAAEGTLAVPLPEGCLSRTDVLGVSRVHEVETSGGPKFGEGQYAGTSFLADGEVVLTFDDGPARRYTQPILDALDAQCTRATFFVVGRMAVHDPEMLRDMARRGHTIATHTWSHKNLASLSATRAKDEIELGLSATSKALGGPISSFFRFPYLGDSRSNLKYLAGRDLSAFSIDVDSKDFNTRNPGTVMRRVLSQLESTRKGIILFHDIQPSTAGAIASLLAALKERGFKVVHIVSKAPAVTLPEYDAAAEKALARKKVAIDVPKTSDDGAKTSGSLVTTSATGEPLPWQPGPAEGGGGATPNNAPQPGKPARPARSTGWKVLPEDNPWQLRGYIGD